MSAQRKQVGNRLYNEDKGLAKRMCSEDLSVREQAWREFYADHEPKVRRIVEERTAKFPDMIRDQVYDALFDKIMKGNLKYLHDYEGRATLVHYLTGKNVAWAITDVLRKRKKENTDSFDELIESGNREIESNASGTEEVLQGLDPMVIEPVDFKVKDVFEELEPEFRWTFLLRYYDDFGFPPREVRALAKASKLPIGVISARINEVFEEMDVLASKREAREQQKEKLLRRWKKILAGKEIPEEARESLKIIETPYKHIAYILGEKEGTLRPRVKTAKEKLKEFLENLGFYF